MQDAPSIKFWGPHFDDFVNISIFMIWGSLGVIWLDGIFVLCMGYLSYVWDIYLMYGILVLCLGYLSYVWDTSLMFWKKNKITCHPGATMVECIVLCLGYLSYVWDICLMYGIFVLCMGYFVYVWDICFMY